jgi:inorganic pyrophosphatase
MFRGLIFSLAVFGFAYAQTTPKVESASEKGPGPADYRIVERTNSGQPTRTYLQQPAGRYISIWHDIPMFADSTNKLYNMVVEVPRGEMDKQEVDLAAPMNPITEKTTLESNTDPIDYIHNYGILPQTWLNGSETEEASGILGNNKPLHIVEISDQIHRIGAVVRVKILGALGIKDGDLIDYKLLGVDASSQIFSQLNTLEDVEKLFPDLLGATRGFFRYYKYPSISDIAFDGKYKDAMDTEKIITNAHDAWDKLIKAPEMPAGLNTASHVPGAAFQADDAEWTRLATN